ncbi:Hypothetical predicted protein [Paramuricea clavata]|uniref:Uncharacterized protein n=2 Tax=Paramuricea clavata TaxID=317549 RepID=A0A6S7GCA9_PARCT|nr:Hypothetical predicted protein [Paramuricea clavata]
MKNLIAITMLVIISVISRSTEAQSSCVDKSSFCIRHCVVIPGIQKRVLKPVENVQVQHNPRVLTKAASAVRHCVAILGIQKSVLKPVENVQVQALLTTARLW